MREQLALALASQQAMKVERDQALEQTRLARERANRLQAQLDRLRAAHGETSTLHTCSSLDGNQLMVVFLPLQWKWRSTLGLNLSFVID